MLLLLLVFFYLVILFDCAFDFVEDVQEDVLIYQVFDLATVVEEIPQVKCVKFGKLSISRARPRR